MAYLFIFYTLIIRMKMIPHTERLNARQDIIRKLCKVERIRLLDAEKANSELSIELFWMYDASLNQSMVSIFL